MQPFNLLGFKIEAEQMQSLNPLLVMILVLRSLGVCILYWKNLAFG